MENNILLDNNAQFILLVGVITTLLTLALLTNRLVDLSHKDKVKNAKNASETLENIKWHVAHLSTVTVIQLGVASLILVRVLLSPWCTNFWFDWAIIAILLVLFFWWIRIHVKYFSDKYLWKKR